MNSQHAEQIITEYLKKLYGFALKKTANLQDAEYLTQEINLKLYSSLLVKDIDNMNGLYMGILKANSVLAKKVNKCLVETIW